MLQLTLEFGKITFFFFQFALYRDRMFRQKMDEQKQELQQIMKERDRLVGVHRELGRMADHFSSTSVITKLYFL
jgi:hypothetical protein